MEYIFYITGVASLAASAGLSYIVLSERIDEGFVIKCGLVTMIAGLLMTAYFTLAGLETFRGLWISSMLTKVGLCIAIVGYWFKRQKAAHNLFRSTDWLIERELFK
jgi:hypothetical protein